MGHVFQYSEVVYLGDRDGGNLDGGGYEIGSFTNLIVTS